MKQNCIKLAFGVALFLIAGATYAQAVLPEGVSPGELEGALSDLSEVYGFPVVRVDQAKAICNEEQYIADCAEIGKQHNLFSEDRVEQVDAVLSELKGNTILQLKQCTDVACLVEVASSIATKLNKNHPTVARAVELTPQKVGEKRDIVEAAESLGVDIEACRTMDPDTASIELLRSCARLAKHADVQKHISAEVGARVAMSDQSIALKESLASGEFQCGNGTLESCGNFCLNPSMEAKSAGAPAIPAVCRQLAERFFGPEGVTQLESAYASVQETYTTFAKRAENAMFTTPEGQTLTDTATIGRYLEAAGKAGNVETVTAGMDFLVANGFVNAADKSFAIAMVSRIRDRGSVDFDQCRANPQSCADIVPESERSQFSAMGEIEQIMRAEMTSRGITDPSRCATDPLMGESCMAAARAALPRMEAIAGRSSETNSLIEKIRQQVRFGEEGIGARKRAEEHFRTVGDVIIGTNEFSSIQELETFCRTNSHECLAESTRAGFVSHNVAADRYEHSAEVRYGMPYSERATEKPPYSEADKSALRAQFEAWLANPNSGQQTPYPTPQTSPYPLMPGDPRNGPCPFVQAPPACSSGEYRQESRSEFGCPFSGACIPFNTETLQPPRDEHYVCPALPTVTSCPSGQERVASFSSPECGTYYSCRAVQQIQPGITFPQTLSNGRIIYTFDEARAYCLANGPSSGSGVAAECREKFGVVYPTTQPGESTECSRYGTGWHTMDQGGNCFNTSMTEYRTPGGALQICSTAPVFGCSSLNTPSQPSGQRQQVWNSYGLQSSIRTDADPLRIDSLKQACANVRGSSSNIWMTGAGNSSSVDFGMPDPEKCRLAASCTTTQYFNGTSCVTSTPQTACGQNQYWDGTLCRSGNTATTTSPCPTGQYWSGGVCIISPSTSCPAGQYWNGSACVTSPSGSSQQRCFYPNASRNGQPVGFTVWCESDYVNCHEGSPSGASVNTTGLSLGAPNSCESGLGGGTYGSECRAKSTQSTCSTVSGCSWYTGYSGGYCDTTGSTGTGTSCPAGQYWSGGVCIISPSTSCPAGQYWNGTSCVATSTTDCPSGQYWSGSSCVSGTGGSTISGSCSSTLMGLLGNGCHSMGNAWFNSEMTRYVLPGGTVVNECMSTSISGCTVWNSSTPPTGGSNVYEGPSSSPLCGDNIDNDLDGLIDTADSGCQSSSSVSTSCTSGQYWNGNACVNSTSTSCPSGQYWNGTACVTTSTTNCPSGQYWSGSSCVSSTPSGTTSAQSGCASAGGSWDSATNYCLMPSSGGASSCTSGQYWNGSACVSSASTSCPSGQWWDGTTCRTTETSSSPSSSCSGSQYWNGSACVDSSSAPSSSCPSGQYWSGSACVSSPTSYFCPSDHDWNGSHCTVAVKSITPESYTASVLNALWFLLGMF